MVRVEPLGIKGLMLFKYVPIFYTFLLNYTGIKRHGLPTFRETYLSIGMKRETDINGGYFG